MSSSKSTLTLALLGDQQAEQVLEVLGVELGGGDRHLAGEVARADHFDAVLDHGLPRLGQLAVAAGLGGEVDDHRAGRHPAHRVGGDQQRRRATGDRGGGDDDVLFGGVLGEGVAHLRVLLVGQRPGVAALALGVGDEVEFQRAAAERGDLLPGGAADVEAGDDRAQPLGGGDGLQAGDAGAEHEHLGRRHGAGGGGHHPEEAAGLAGGDQHRRVAGGGGLRGERVHRLGARRARDRLHREAGDAGLRQRLVGLGRGPGREVADEDLVRVELGDLGAGGGGDAKDDVGAPRNLALDDLGSGLGVLRVGMAGGVAGTALDQHLDVLVLLQRLDHVRDQRDPALPMQRSLSALRSSRGAEG